MTYEEALKTIHSLDSFGIKPGLDRIKRFLKEIGNPQDNLKFVHIAGTNGKGSTCALISSVLTESNLKTGLFISPFITDFRERIQINGQMISKKTLTSAVEETFPILLKLQKENCIITEFEYVMALEFYIHAKEKCDIVVLETGLGGLLDCTNVIKPPLATVITTIGLDHTGILGNTIEEIAYQKAGIIKDNSTVITSTQPKSVIEIIKNTVQKHNCKYIENSEIKLTNIKETLTNTTYNYDGLNITLNLIGAHQIENSKTALATIKVLQNFFNITNDNIINGFEKAVNPARFEILSHNPLVILDGAHNPNGIEALKNALNKHIDAAVCMIGMLADKDSETSLHILQGLFAKVYTTNVNNPRNLGAEKLKERCLHYFDNVEAIDNPFNCFDNALTFAKENNLPLIICGSLYLAGKIRPYIMDKLQK